MKTKSKQFNFAKLHIEKIGSDPELRVRLSHNLRGLVEKPWLVIAEDEGRDDAIFAECRSKADAEYVTQIINRALAQIERTKGRK